MPAFPGLHVLKLRPQRRRFRRVALHRQQVHHHCRHRLQRELRQPAQLLVDVVRSPGEVAAPRFLQQVRRLARQFRKVRAVDSLWRGIPLNKRKSGAELAEAPEVAER